MGFNTARSTEPIRSDTFKPGQLVDWVADGEIFIKRCRVIRLTDDVFVSYDKLIPCWEVDFLDGTTGVIAEKGLRPVVLHS